MAVQDIRSLLDDAEALGALIGRRVHYLDGEYEIADLLPEEGLMILASADSKDVQEDSYGRPHRLVPRRHTLRFRDADGAPTAVWEEMGFLDGPLLD